MSRRTPVFILSLLLSFGLAQLEPVQVNGETLSATDTLPHRPRHSLGRAGQRHELLSALQR